MSDQSDCKDEGPARTMMKVVIDRSTWYRGLGGNESMLVRSSDGRMCCLGFVGRMCGYAPAELRHPDPEEQVKDLHRMEERFSSYRKNLWPEALLGREGRIRNTSLTDELVTVNDDPLISEEERERRIAELLAAAGIDASFEGEDWRGEHAIAEAREKYVNLKEYP